VLFLQFVKIEFLIVILEIIRQIHDLCLLAAGEGRSHCAAAML